MTFDDERKKLHLELEEMQRNYDNAFEQAFADAVANQDNALKRAMIPIIKAMTKALNSYSRWAGKHRQASNMIVGMVVLFPAMFLFGIIAFSPYGRMSIMIAIVIALVFSLREMING
jgi:hypothetical protein